MKKHLFYMLLAAMSWQTGSAQIVINELMQSNIDCIMDDINEFPDSWVELYNAGEGAVNLQAYRLGITDKASEAWKLPNKSIEAHGYALVYCDKEGKDMHTPFRLESGKGCEVYLFEGETIVDKITGLKKQPAPNIAYGRRESGGTEWGYQASPTPGAANCGRLCTKILDEPVFSVKGKVVTSSQSFQLTLSLPEGTPEGTSIHYTTDGREPTQSNAQYSGPITISSTKTIRAKLFCDGYLSPRSTTHSYIFFPRKLTLPVISIVTNKDYFYNNTTGIYVDGTYQNGKMNYEFDWRRPINLEFFVDENKESVINQLCETRIMGGATRSNQYKSLAVYANKRFGTKRLEYEFFPDQRPGITDFKSIALRNAGNDFDYLYMRDAIIQRTMASHVDLDWQAWRPAIIYLNGEYMGMLNIRERSNEDNIYSNYDGLEDIDMFENWYELKEGDWDNYNRFKQFYAEHGHTLQEYEKWIDWEEFINLMVMNLYYNNQDFPGNNIVMWRPRTENGRWRFIAKDTDFGLGLYGSSASYNTIKWLYDPNYDSNRNWANQYDHTRLFRRMMEDDDFKREFIDRAAIYMGDFMNEKGTRAVWDPMYEMIKTEYPNHRKLINQWWPNYNDELNNARNWIRNRTSQFYQQLADYYQTGTPVAMTINQGSKAEDLEKVKILFNGIRLSEGLFDGKFFTDRSVTLKGEAIDDENVINWTITTVANNGTSTTTTAQGEEYSFNMPSCKRLDINATIGKSTGIQQVGNRQWTWSSNGNMIRLSGVERGTMVRLFNLQGQMLWQGTVSGDDIQILLPSGEIHLLKVGSETLKIR
ncbi:MAG: CotH kinase family protein [Prevotella sp.]|nr:CotH kinase family protein [Prevotella sp.]